MALSSLANFVSRFNNTFPIVNKWSPISVTSPLKSVCKILSASVSSFNKIFFSLVQALFILLVVSISVHLFQYPVHKFVVSYPKRTQFQCTSWLALCCTVINYSIVPQILSFWLQGKASIDLSVGFRGQQFPVSAPNFRGQTIRPGCS